MEIVRSAEAKLRGAEAAIAADTRVRQQGYLKIVLVSDTVR